MDPDGCLAVVGGNVTVTVGVDVAATIGVDVAVGVVVRSVVSPSDDTPEKDELEHHTWFV